jgi:hypothetical protein
VKINKKRYVIRNWAVGGPVILEIVALLEKVMKDNIPGFAGWMQTTGASIPWFPEKKLKGHIDDHTIFTIFRSSSNNSDRVDFVLAAEGARFHGAGE